MTSARNVVVGMNLSAIELVDINYRCSRVVSVVERMKVFFYRNNSSVTARQRVVDEWVEVVGTLQQT